MARVTGSLVLRGKAKDTVYLKARDGAGNQHMKRLGKLHTGRGKPCPDAYTRKQADDALRDWLTDLGRAPARPESMPFRDAARAWLHYVEHEKHRAPSTVSDYRNVVRTDLEPRFGSVPLGSITTEDIDAFRRELLSRVSPRTAQKVLVILHAALKYAKRRKWIPANPAEDAERVTLRRRSEFAVLAPDEVQAVSRASTDGQLGALTLVAAFTGLRMGELRALRWRDIEFALRLIHVRRSRTRRSEGTTKSGKARSVPLIDQAAVALDGLSRRSRWTGPDDHVFVNVVGNQLDDSVVRKGLYAAMKAAGIDRDRGTGKAFVFHDLRHTFGTFGGSGVRAVGRQGVHGARGHSDDDALRPPHAAARRR